MSLLLSKLVLDFPALSFQAGTQFCWSPKHKQIYYLAEAISETLGQWSLLHEVGHGTLGHTGYSSDFELVQLEAAAWKAAEQLAQTYGCPIDPDHIQDCLDTYRDWLHRRSTCPLCGIRCLQANVREYRCFNCQTKWHVSSSRFCRPYRRLATSMTKSSFDSAQDLRQAPTPKQILNFK
jgi:hypothetical protein